MGNTWCPICTTNLNTSGRTMQHLKFRHYMLDQHLDNNATEDVTLDGEEFVDIARTLYPAPASGPIPEFPDYSKRQSDNDQGPSTEENTDTSTTTANQTGKENEANKPEG